MTGIGIVISFITFVTVVWYLSKKQLQSFWRFFYWLPLFIALVYFFWSYTQFILSSQHILPHSFAEAIRILSPYGYKFHFAGMLLGYLIALLVFFSKVKTTENKKIWIDIFFFATALSLVPMGIFLLLGDNFIGQATDSFWGMKSLHSESQRNKFNAVYPIGIFLSIWSLLLALGIYIKKISTKKKGYGFLGFFFLLLVINLVLILQQYPRYMVVPIWKIQLDIKQHLSFLVMMYCLYLHKKHSAPHLIIEK